MTRTWTQSGDEHTRDARDRFAAAFERLDWQAAPRADEAPLLLPMAAGHGINAAIRELRLPRVSHVAVSHEVSPFGLYGIRAHYQNGRADVYVLDCGDECVVVASDFYPAEEVSAVA